MYTRNSQWWVKISSFLIGMVVIFSLGGAKVFAQEGTPEQSGQSFLIAPAMPEMQSMDVPRFLDEAGVQRLTEKIMAEQSAAMRRELRELEQQGMIANIEPAEGGVYRLTVLDPGVIPQLEKLTAAGALQEDIGETPACLLDAQEKQPDQLKEMIQMRQMQGLQAEGAEIQPAGLKINIYINPYSSYSYVYGTGAPPFSEIKMSLLRGGIEVAYSYGFSDDGGDYYFYPDYSYCVDYSYSWTVKAGDTVKITVGGITSQTVAAPIQGWGNADTNVVSGTTSPYRSVRLTIWQMNRAAPCGPEVKIIKTGSANAAGSFSINTTSAINFDRSASIMLESLDASGHATVSYADPFHLLVLPWGYIYGAYLPDQPYVLVLKRGEVILETLYGTTEPDGYYYDSFTVDPLAGDHAIFTSGAFSMSYNYIEVQSLSINRDTGQVSGTATPGVIVMPTRYNETYVATSRCGASSCTSSTIPGGGSFNLNIGQAFRGEDIVVFLVTTEGEMYGYASQNSAIGADAFWDEAYIYWSYYVAGDLTVTLKDGIGTIKETKTAYQDWYDYYYAWFSEDVIPGDIIEVTDGDFTESMTVQNLGQPWLNSTTNRLTGTAPLGGRVLAEINSQQNFDCREAESTGSYNFLMPWDVKANESAYVNFRGPDGHYTNASTSSLSMDLSLHGTYGYAVLETPAALLTWTHKRGGISIGTDTVASNLFRYVSISLDEVALPGDLLIISTSDGNYYELSIPTLTVNLDPAGRRIYGQAPANQWLDLWLFRSSPDSSYYQYFEGRSSGAGQYSTSLPKDLYWNFNCSIANLAHPCLGVEAEAANADGFRFWISEWPDSAAADAYEADDTFTQASIFSGFQQHTLHLWEDEDWIQFTVTPQDVSEAHNFHLNTIQLGWDMDLYMELYATDGATLLASDNNENYNGAGQGPQIYYTFAAPGDYYLRIHSKPESGDWDGGYCDSVYTLLIIPDEQFLYIPLIRR